MLCMRYFGTDGIRDRADALLQNDIPRRLGKALGATSGKVIVARDVRESSPAIERALVQGLLEGDAQIYLAGVLPTPALAYIAEAHDARYAVMITASHNPPEFNGLKVFSRGGRKLSAREEEALDAALSSSETLSDGGSAGSERNEVHRVRVMSGAEREYADHIVSLFFPFFGERVTIDAANGCMAGVARRVFEALSVSVTAINDVRDGSKVNVDCGSTHLDALLGATPKNGIGFAFDGDGDRALAVVDGKPYDGDAILLSLSTLYRVKGKLKRRLVVGTDLTGSKLSQALAAQNIALLRTAVGDKHVLAALTENGCSLGGEKSGHILMPDKANTGDGLITALTLLEAKRTLGSLPSYEPYPSLEFNVRSEDPQSAMKSEKMRKMMETLQKAYGDKGRFVYRASGTEPYIRVMYECFSKDFESVFEKIKEAFEIS